METATRSVEVQNQYEFMDVEHMQGMRDQQDAQLRDARKQAIASGPHGMEGVRTAYASVKEAEEQTKASFDQQAHEYVSQYIDREHEPDKYNYLVTLVRG